VRVSSTQRGTLIVSDASVVVSLFSRERLPLEEGNRVNHDMRGSCFFFSIEKKHNLRDTTKR
jgi:hypothetical protein